jgi:hypothetical protein
LNIWDGQTPKFKPNFRQQGTDIEKRGFWRAIVLLLSTSISNFPGAGEGDDLVDIVQKTIRDKRWIRDLGNDLLIRDPGQVDKDDMLDITIELLGEAVQFVLQQHTTDNFYIIFDNVHVLLEADRTYFHDSVRRHADGGSKTRFLLGGHPNSSPRGLLRDMSVIDDASQAQRKLRPAKSLLSNLTHTPFRLHQLASLS